MPTDKWTGAADCLLSLIGGACRPKSRRSPCSNFKPLLNFPFVSFGPLSCYRNGRLYYGGPVGRKCWLVSDLSSLSLIDSMYQLKSRRAPPSSINSLLNFPFGSFGPLSCCRYGRLHYGGPVGRKCWLVSDSSSLSSINGVYQSKSRRTPACGINSLLNFPFASFRLCQNHWK